jgi:hypothetical protein
MKEIIYDLGTTGETLQLQASNEIREGCEDECGALHSITGVHKIERCCHYSWQVPTATPVDTLNLRICTSGFYTSLLYIFFETMLHFKRFHASSKTYITNFHFNFLVLAMKICLILCLKNSISGNLKTDTVPTMLEICVDKPGASLSMKVF